MYLGDRQAGDLVDLKFTTYAQATWDGSAAPSTLGGTPVVSVYKNNSTTESVTGVTLTVDFDARTGLNHVRVDTSADATFYAAGNDYQIVLTTGTVDGVSAVGKELAHFSIANRSVSVSAAAIRAAIGLASANLDTQLTAIDDYVDTEVAAIKAKTDQLVFTVANQVDVNVLDWKSATAPAMTGDAYARLGAPAGASVSVDVAAVKADTAAVKAKTDNLPIDPADASDIAASFAGLSIPTANQNADALLDRSNAIETGWTLRGLFRILGAVMSGKLSGAGTGTEVFRAADDSKDRVTATVDASGNRSVVTTDKT